MAKIIGTLTSPTTFDSVNTRHYETNVFDVEVSNINTSIEVSIEGTYDKNTYVNVDKETVTITSDGVTRFILKPELRLEAARVNWISETGGTTAEVTVTHIGF